MKICIALCAILAVSTARVLITADNPSDPHLLGEEECTWGPSYWCENIKTAAGCNATKHCIKTIWKDMEVPEDNDSVCTICKDMVQQARDQLESNQTQQDLKAVFEGSCKLIHIKTIVEECIKIVDQFIPELVETLASQMNPSVVCSVSGLCNSARIDKMLLEYEQSTPKIDKLKARSLEKDELEPDECSKCYTVATHMEQKIHNTPHDKMLRQILILCGELGTFSDACSATILTYFNTIYSHLQENFNAPNICHLSGQCSDNFHKHEDTDKTLKVEIRPLSSVGMVDVGDDLPCKLCEQLVGHLRDLLVANTTEAEFQVVLEGLCKQTKSFSTECTAIVDEYYPQIYQYLTKELNSNFICQMSGMCPAPDKAMENPSIWPLVPRDAAKIGVHIFQNAKENLESEKQSPELSKSEVESMQLPIERLIPFPISEGPSGVNGKETCALCEYVLHYIQDTMTNPVTEDKLKQALGKVCAKLPESIKDECTEFVDTYGDAIVAIFVEELDPSQVCPMLRLCPTERLMKFWNSVPAKYMLENEQSKPSCPLCLLAISEVYNVIKNNKTEGNIQNQLNKLCSHLPESLSEECQDFVKGYSKELIELLLADLTPQEVCVYIKLCDDTKSIGPRNGFITDKDNEILTNEIPDASVPMLPDKVKNPSCALCEFAIHYVDKELDSKNDKEKVEKIVHGVCNHLPKTLSRECNDFVNNYADIVIDYITKGVSPKQVCSMMGLCTFLEKKMKEAVTECAVCKSIVSVIDQFLDDPNVDNDIKQIISKVCRYIPASNQSKCISLIDVYGQSIINLIARRENMDKICSKIALCAPNDYTSVALENSRIKRSYEKNRIKHCTWGPVYWCSTNETAQECKAVEHCKENVWKADFAPPKQITLSETEPNV